MDGDSSTLGVMDSEERMVNELENDGSGDAEADAVMVGEELNEMDGDWVHVEELEEVIVELGDPVLEMVELGEASGDIVGLAEGDAVIEEDQEGAGDGDMVLDQEG